MAHGLPGFSPPGSIRIIIVKRIDRQIRLGNRDFFFLPVKVFWDDSLEQDRSWDDFGTTISGI